MTYYERMYMTEAEAGLPPRDIPDHPCTTIKVLGYGERPTFGWQYPLRDKTLPLTARYGIEYKAKYVNIDYTEEQMSGKRAYKGREVWYKGRQWLITDANPHCVVLRSHRDVHTLTWEQYRNRG